jgi:Asp-tRNA(Asn)/Glu-tRNA(Gln) amidotransferase A subunit family amidase
VVRTHEWHLAEPDTHAAIDRAARAAGEAGAVVTARELPAVFAELGAAHARIMTFEAARALAWERRHHAGRLSPRLRAFLEAGDRVAPAQVDEARLVVARARALTDDVFGDADVLLTPAVTGEAPHGLDSTGDPRFAWTWTLLGWPALSVPGSTGRTGLPVGVQLVGRESDDARVLEVGAWLGAALAAHGTR